MRRSFRQHRLRAAEDLFLKVILLVVLMIGVSVAVIYALDDGSSPKTQVEGAQANRAQTRPVAVVPSTLAPMTTTTTVAPPAPVPDLRGLAAFLAATQAKARQDAAAAAAAAAAHAPPAPVVTTTPTTAPPPPSTTTTSSTTTSTSTTTTTKPR